MRKEAYHSNGLEHVRTWCAVASLVVGFIILTVVITK